MGGVTATLKLNKSAGNLEKLDPATRQAFQDAALDAIDAFLTSLTAVEVDTTSAAIGIKEGTVILNGSGALAMTFLAPVAGARSAGGDDGKKLKIIAGTAHAHTATGPADVIGGANDKITFAAAGDWCELVASNGTYVATLGGPTPAALEV